MKKMLLGLLISARIMATGEIITMPEKRVLQERLDSIGLRYFAKKTNIISQLADQKKAALGVAVTVDLSLYDYFEYIKKSMPEQMVRIQMVQMDMHKSLIFEALLKDEPAALEELKSLGLYKTP